MLKSSICAVRSASKTIFSISILTLIGSGIMTVSLSLDTPWAPWESGNTVFFPPLTFTIASFFAAFLAVSGGTILLNILSHISNNPCKLWRILSAVFLVMYGLYSFSSGTFQAGIMLNILHLIVAIPSLIFIPKVVTLGVKTPLASPN